ncbi:hypothetical protein McaMca56_004868 [Microsporum canis]
MKLVIITRELPLGPPDTGIKCDALNALLYSLGVDGKYQEPSIYQLFSSSRSYKNIQDNTWLLLCPKIREICVSAEQPDLDIEIGGPLSYNSNFPTPLARVVRFLMYGDSIANIIGEAGLGDVAAETGRAVTHPNFRFDNDDPEED